MTSPCRRMSTSWTTISMTISDIQQSLTNSHKLMNKQTYIGMLRQGNTGKDLLAILDLIAQEDADQAPPLAQYGRSDEIDF